MSNLTTILFYLFRYYSNFRYYITNLYRTYNYNTNNIYDENYKIVCCLNKDTGADLTYNITRMIYIDEILNSKSIKNEIGIEKLIIYYFNIETKIPGIAEFDLVRNKVKDNIGQENDILFNIISLENI